jgi:quinol monooxygenase YgiN
MSDGVIGTVTWSLRPELTDACVEALSGMFAVTRTHAGFRNIRLLRSEIEPDTLILIQEWDSVQDHLNYMRFRAENGDIDRLTAMTMSPPQIGYWATTPLAAAQA